MPRWRRASRALYSANSHPRAQRFRAASPPVPLTMAEITFTHGCHGGFVTALPLFRLRRPVDGRRTIDAGRWPLRPAVLDGGSTPGTSPCAARPTLGRGKWAHRGVGGLLADALFCYGPSRAPRWFLSCATAGRGHHRGRQWPLDAAAPGGTDTPARRRRPLSTYKCRGLRLGVRPDGTLWLGLTLVDRHRRRPSIAVDELPAAGRFHPAGDTFGHRPGTMAGTARRDPVR